jgi:predicted RNA-binding protein
MCEAKVFFAAGDQKQLIMKDVVSIKPVPEGLELIDLFGEKKVVKASLLELKLLDHIVLLKPEA